MTSIPEPGAPSSSSAWFAPVTCGISISVDGFAAGPRQSLDHPIGEGGDRLHRWMFEQPDANAAELAALTSAGAYIMGRNMFGPAAAPGTRTGAAGGARSRLTTRWCSCSATIRATR